MAPLSADTVLLFYREPAQDTLVPYDRHLRRAVRPIYKRLKGDQKVTGFLVQFRALVKALRLEGVEVRVNDYRLARCHPEHPVGLAGYPEVLDGWRLPNPALIGPGMFDHPKLAPDLMKDPRFRAYVVTCDWMRALFAPYYGEDRLVRWYGGLDLDEWPDTRGQPKPLDVLVYDKIRWSRDEHERELVEPVLDWLRTQGLSWHRLHYGAYQHATFRSLLGQARSMLFLCENETQGLAYQEAMASGVPVLAWDNGFWCDPQRLKFQTEPVPASSVPFFSPECGERFRSFGDFAPAAERFFSGLEAYDPRGFVARELSFEGSAGLYLSAYRALLPRPERAPGPRNFARPPRQSEGPGAPANVFSGGGNRMRVSLAGVPIDSLTFAEALDAIEALVADGRGGYVVTPNVDHVVQLERDRQLRDAYARASLVLVDGKPLVWASKLLGTPLPEKISGSDLVLPLIERAARRGWRVFLSGGAPGVAELAAQRLRRELAVEIAGVDAPRITLGEEGLGGESLQALERIRAARPHLVLLAYGTPKQEVWLREHAAAMRPAVGLGIGAGIDFVAGTARRAPSWASDAGLEWAWRLAREPRRLWRRYLVDDPRFAVMLARALKARWFQRG